MQCYARNRSLLKNKITTKKTKTKIYKTLMRPILAHSLETTRMNEKDKEDLKIAERKIMRTILGHKHNKTTIKAPKNQYGNGT